MSVASARIRAGGDISDLHTSWSSSRTAARPLTARGGDISGRWYEVAAISRPGWCDVAATRHDVAAGDGVTCPRYRRPGWRDVAATRPDLAVDGRVMLPRSQGPGGGMTAISRGARSVILSRTLRYHGGRRRDSAAMSRAPVAGCRSDAPSHRAGRRATLPRHRGAGRAITAMFVPPPGPCSQPRCSCRARPRGGALRPAISPATTTHQACCQKLRRQVGAWWPASRSLLANRSRAAPAFRAHRPVDGAWPITIRDAAVPALPEAGASATSAVARGPAHASVT